MTDRDKNMYALGMLQMAKIVIAATREINIVYSDPVMYAMGVGDTVKKISIAIDATIDNVEDIFEKEWVRMTAKDSSPFYTDDSRR